MKTLRLPFLFLLCLGLLVWTGCGSDDEDPLIIETLNYDGPNFTAPNLDANTFATFFPPSEIAPFADRELESVQFWLTDLPPTVRVVIFEAGDTDAAPSDNVIYERNITQRINAVNTWITDRITPFRLGDYPDGIWIAIETGITEGNRIQSVGCDAGTNYNPNGDRIKIGDEWLNFSDLGEAINWNIRGVLAPVE